MGRHQERYEWYIHTHPLRTGIWTLNVSDDMEVKILEKRKVALEVEGQCHIHINSKRNAFGLSRSIFFLSNHQGDILHNTFLLQYHTDKENCNEVVFEVAPPMEIERMVTSLSIPHKRAQCRLSRKNSP